MSLGKAMTIAAQAANAKHERNAALEEALVSLKGEPQEITLPSGMRVRLKRPSVQAMMGGNPFADDEGGGDPDELLKMLKISKGG